MKLLYASVLLLALTAVDPVRCCKGKKPDNPDSTTVKPIPPPPKPEHCAQVLCCGSNGVTYPTPCSTPPGVTCVDFNTCPAECPNIIRLVCGSDGKTYGNMCLLTKAGVNMRRDGPCHIIDPAPIPSPRPNPGGCPCTKLLHPVCTSGICSIRLRKDTNFRPVCGANGKTYPNMCELRCAGVMKKRNGPCRRNCRDAGGKRRWHRESWACDCNKCFCWNGRIASTRKRCSNGVNPIGWRGRGWDDAWVSSFLWGGLHFKNNDQLLIKDCMKIINYRLYEI